MQALRALAVGLVVLFHLWPARLPGGYVGVDVFFVISGYLITGHLLREIDGQGTIGLAGFWSRRIRRLLPAAMLVLAVTVAGIVLWVPRAQWTDFLHEVAASALYVENWALAQSSTDYFASEAAASPVQHYWSLSVEEQFYLVWPLLVTLALVARRYVRVGAVTAVAVVVGSVFVASLAYSVVATADLRAYAYFASPAHAWELAGGGLLALAHARSSGRRLPAGVRAGASWLGLGAIVASAFLYTGDSPFPGWIALLPVGGAVLVIAAGSPEARWAPSRLMALPPVQRLGDASYSVYLWHWPLIILGFYALERELLWRDKLVVLAATLVLAGLTKRYVEDPGRHAAWLGRRPRTAYLAAAGATAVLLLAVAGGQATATRERDRLAAQAEELRAQALGGGDRCFGAAAGPASDRCRATGPLVPAPEVAADDGPTEHEACRVSHNQEDLRVCHIVEAPPPAPRVALIGDSHAEQWLPALEVIAQQRGWSLDTYLKGGCPVSEVMRTDDAVRGANTCRWWNDQLSEVLAAERYDVLVTSAVAGKEYETVEDETDLQAAERGLALRWRQLAALGSQVVVIRDNPAPGFDVPLCLDREQPTPDEYGVVCTTPRDQALLDDAQLGAAKATGVPIVDVTDALCDDQACHAVVGGVVAYRDDDHLTKTFVLTLVPQIDAALEPVVTGAS